MMAVSLYISILLLLSINWEQLKNAELMPYMRWSWLILTFRPWQFKKNFFKQFCEGLIILDLTADFPKSKCRRPIDTPSLIVWEIFRGPPFSSTRCSALYSQYSTHYICMVETFPCPTYPFKLSENYLKSFNSWIFKKEKRI